jgi:hypothetical protein
MSIGVGIFLMVLGAILAFAVEATTPGINLNTLGIILLLTGLIAVLYSLLFWSNLSPWGRRRTVARRRTWSRSDPTGWSRTGPSRSSRSARSRWSRSVPLTTVFPSILKTRSAAGLAQRTSRHRGNRWVTWRWRGYRCRSALQARLSCVRAGSVPQRSRTGISGHQQSPTVQRNRRSPALQLRQLGCTPNQIVVERSWIRVRSLVFQFPQLTGQLRLARGQLGHLASGSVKASFTPT